MVKNLFSEPHIKPVAHLTPQKGTKAQARDYCQKSDTRICENYDYGEFVAEGERADLAQLKELVDASVGDYELGNIVCRAYEQHMPFVDRHRQINSCEKFGKVRRLDLEVTYIYGEAGVGKTRRVMDKNGYTNVYRITT